MLEVRDALSRWEKPALVLFSDSDRVFSPTHAERCGLKLACDPEGLPTKFLFQLNTDTAMAFITREAIHRTSDKPPDSDARASPLWPLVRLAYLGPGARAAGEVPADAGAGDPEIERHWPGIVIEELRR